MKRITSLTALTLCILATSASGAATPRPPHTLPADPEADNSYFAEICAIGAGGSGGGGTSPSPRQSPGSPVKTIPTPRSRMGTPAVCILPTISEYDIAADRERDVNINLTLAHIQLCDQMINEINDFIDIVEYRLETAITKLATFPELTTLYQRMQSVHYKQAKNDIKTISAARTALTSATSHSIINAHLEKAKKAFNNACSVAEDYCNDCYSMAVQFEAKRLPDIAKLFEQAAEKLLASDIPRMENTIEMPYKLALKDIEYEFAALDISADLHKFDAGQDIVDNGLADLKDYASQVSAAITSLFSLLADPYLPVRVSVHWPVIAKIMPLLKTHRPLELKKIVETIWTNKSKTHDEKVNLFCEMNRRRAAIEPVDFDIICAAKIHMKIAQQHKKDFREIQNSVNDIFTFFESIAKTESRVLAGTLIQLGTAKNILDTQATDPAKQQQEIYTAVCLFDLTYADTTTKESIATLIARAPTENPAERALWYEYTAHDGSVKSHSAEHHKSPITQAEIADKCRFIETTIEAHTTVFRAARHKTAHAARHLGAGAHADD